MTERIRENITLTIDKKILQALKDLKDKTGVPISQSLERAWLKVHGKDVNAG